MERHKWTTGHVTSTGEWTPWHMHKGFQVKCMYDGTWIHILKSHPSESNPDANHIHYKFKFEGGRHYSFALCSMKVDGMRKVNRRELIEKINRVTGLNLSYK